MFSLLGDAWHMGVTAFGVVVLRLLLLPLLLYNMTWSFKGCIEFLNNRQFPISLIQSMVFFMSTGVLIRHIIFFTTEQQPVSYLALMALCLLSIASLLAAISHRLHLTRGFNKFYWLLGNPHLDIAVKAAELAHADRQYMEGALEAAETAIAVGIAKRAMR